ncbi:hypothetical protein K439DRAFT_1624080 [Ramaria rubella]|nr:hypothetical protein K439DRAFT_1624080 [Ramaria rubella]
MSRSMCTLGLLFLLGLHCLLSLARDPLLLLLLPFGKSFWASQYTGVDVNPTCLLALSLERELQAEVIHLQLLDGGMGFSTISLQSFHGLFDVRDFECSFRGSMFLPLEGKLLFPHADLSRGRHGDTDQWLGVGACVRVGFDEFPGHTPGSMAVCLVLTMRWPGIGGG